MTTKYSCGDIVYIPCEIKEIEADKYGIRYRFVLDRSVSIYNTDDFVISETALVEKMKRVYVNEEE